MTQPVNSAYTMGQQGPPGVGLSFGGLAIASASANLVANALTPIDTRTAALTFTFPAATDGMIVGISDLYGASLTHTVTLLAVGSGVTLADPSTPGTYAATGHISRAGISTYWWVFVQGTIPAPVAAWLPLWWV
jgi:hypothetical protein